MALPVVLRASKDMYTQIVRTGANECFVPERRRRVPKRQTHSGGGRQRDHARHRLRDVPLRHVVQSVHRRHHHWIRRASITASGLAEQVHLFHPSSIPLAPSQAWHPRGSSAWLAWPRPTPRAWALGRTRPRCLGTWQSGCGRKVSSTGPPRVGPGASDGWTSPPSDTRPSSMASPAST